MTENVKKLFELSSQDEKLRKALCEAPDVKSIISLAAEHEITLTEEELKMDASKEQELDEEELASVAGGDECYCAIAGGGLRTDKYTPPCGCALYGQGNSFCETQPARCACLLGGHGNEL